jgi:membrane-associated phospholipid phosphatase
VTLSYYFVDRPVAIFAHEHLRDTRLFLLFWHFTMIPEVLFPLATLPLVAVALRAAAGLSLDKINPVLVRCSLSLVTAWAFKDELKVICGRSWPEPWHGNTHSFFSDGTYGFAWLQGDVADAAFPSGHTTVIFAIGVVLWFSWRHLRLPTAVLAALTIIGLLGRDDHWLSDIIAGAYLGTATAATALAIAPPKIISKGPPEPAP